MKLKPITSKSLKKIQKRLDSSNYGIDLFEDFFDNLSLLIKESESISEKISSLLEDMSFDSEDATDEFLEFYEKYFNSTVVLFEIMESSGEEKSVSMVQDLADGLIDIGDNDLSLLGKNTIKKAMEIVEVVFDKYSIDHSSDEAVIKSLEAKFSEEIITIFAGIFEVSQKIEGDKKVDPEDIKLLMSFVIILVFQMNILRKTELDDEFNKIGRNDPCPCGSGKKYKKCCLGTVH